MHELTTITIAAGLPYLTHESEMSVLLMRGQSFGCVMVSFLNLKTFADPYICDFQTSKQASLFVLHYLWDLVNGIQLSLEIWGWSDDMDC